MSPAPSSPGDRGELDRYASAWADMVQLVTDGHSWSGNERNVCYLNEGSGQFADISYLSGLDFPDDGRALGVTDWDQDGDLDLWFRNRTAPRLRLMLNQRSQVKAVDFVAFRLESVEGNRDGIGAIVIVLPDGHSDSRLDKPLVKSLRAGDLFLSQSSKWLHFGLGNCTGIQKVRVRWPGGVEETFAGARAGGRYVLKQGEGEAVPSSETAQRTVTTLSKNTSGWEARRTESGARILLPARIPLFPDFAFRSPAGRAETLQPSERARLLLIWSQTCPHCHSELTALTEAAPDLHRNGVEVLALSVDGLADGETLPDTSDVYARMDALKFPFPWGFVDRASLERLDLLQNALFDRSIPFSVPLALLLDAENNVLAIYRGPISIDDVLADALATNQATDETLYHMAPPLAGQWFTNPVTGAYVAENLARQFHPHFPEDALAYLHLAAERSAGDKQQTLLRELAARHHSLARQFREQIEPEKAVIYFEKALHYAPDSPEIHHDYGVLLASYGKLAEAEACFQTALQIDPNLQASREALETIRRIRSGRR